MQIYRNRLVAGLLALSMLFFLLAACGPAQPTTTEEATSAVEANENEDTAVSSEASSGSQVTASGLEYIEVEEGTGPSPEPGDIVSVHYTGKLGDGTVFDSSEGGDPIQFPLGQGYVIPGWDEGIALMKEGGKAQLIIPPELAYGDQESPSIPANSTLYFDVELVSVEPAPTPEPAPEPAAIDDADYTVTDSGLKIYTLEEGDGEMPQPGEIAAVYFAGWLEEDGTLIGDRLDGVPVEFAVGEGQIMPGWDEAVQLMQVGERVQMIIPPELALGEEGAPGVIPPNASLIFEMELVSVSPPPPTPTPAPPPTSIEESEYTVTDSGLKYYILTEGDGPTPQPGDTVSVHYRLWLEDGTQIDSSYDRGEPFPFPVGSGSTIPGFEEGIMLIHEGGSAQLVIPPELGYGDTSNGPIPPNSTLIFEVEVVSVESAE